MTISKEQNLSKKTLTSKDYVQDGLLFHIDAIDNMGVGEHKNGIGFLGADLVQGIHYGDVQSVEWSDTSFRIIDSGPSQLTNSLTKIQTECPSFWSQVQSELTYEVLYSGKNLIGFYDTKCGFMLCNVNTADTYCDAYLFLTRVIARQVEFDGKMHLMSAVKSKDKKVRLFRDGIMLAQEDDSLDAFIEPSNKNGYLYKGQCLAGMRMYSRALTEDEMLRNYEVDKARFGL